MLYPIELRALGWKGKPYRRPLTTVDPADGNRQWLFEEMDSSDTPMPRRSPSALQPW
jgi:hypothetical protein